MTADKTTRQNRVREALGRLYDQQPPYFREYLRRFQEDPTSRVFAPLAEAYRRLGRVDEAIEICREGLEHHPDFHGGRVAYAKCLVDKKQFPDARRELERVVYAVPENLLAQRLLAEVNSILGDVDAALHAFKMALLLSPADVGLAEKVHQLERESGPPGQAAPVSIEVPPPAPVVEDWQPSDDIGFVPEASRPPASARDEYVERDLQKTPDPLSPSNSLEALLNSDEELGDDLAPLWQVDENTGIGHLAPVPPKGAGHDDMFVAEPLAAEAEGLGMLDENSEEDDEAPLEIGSAEPVVDEGLEALLGREENSAVDEPFKVEHVSQIFQDDQKGASPQEITTETLGDLYFSQGQFERALKIFEKLGDVNSPEIARKIQACKSRLGVTREQMVRNRQIETLKKVLGRAKSA